MSKLEWSIFSFRPCCCSQIFLQNKPDSPSKILGLIFSAGRAIPKSIMFALKGLSFPDSSEPLSESSSESS
jgi:hypothetical protein